MQTYNSIIKKATKKYFLKKKAIERNKKVVFLNNEWKLGNLNYVYV